MAILIGDALLKIGVDKSDLDKGMQSLGDSIKKHNKAIGIAMTAMGAAILGGFALSMKASAEFGKAMREVNTMMGLSEEEFAAFSSEVQALAENLGVNAVESANALYQAISAGVPKENVLEFLEIATKAAIGGVTDTETAVDGLTTVINAFKLPITDAQKVADLMFTTVKGGKTTFDELSEALFQVSPMAAASGIGFEEVSAALATMTKQGVPTKVATTQLRQAMMQLQRPTVEMGEAINSLGYASGQAMLEELGFAGTLNKLRDATNGNNELLMAMFASVEAGGAVLALTGSNAITFAGDLDAMAKATGASTDAFKEMEKSASRQMEGLKSSFKDIAISVGNILLPILKDIVDKIKPIIESIINWTKENPQLMKTIIIIVGAIGSLLLVLGPLLVMLPGIIAALPILGAAFAALMGPVGIAIAAIAGLVTVVILVYKNWDKITEFFTGLWDGVTEIFHNWVDNIKEFLSKLNPWEWIKQGWENLREGIGGILKGIFGGSDVENWVSDLNNYLSNFDLSASGKAMFSSFQNGISEALKETKENVEKAIEDILGGETPASQSEIIAAHRADIAREERRISYGQLKSALKGKGLESSHAINIANVVVYGDKDYTLTKADKELLHGIGVAGYKYGGPIIEDTLLFGLKSLRPYAVAHEGERVTPMSQTSSVLITGNTFNVREEADIRKIGEELTRQIRLRTGVRI